jgi:hypothetical protein
VKYEWDRGKKREKRGSGAGQRWSAPGARVLAVSFGAGLKTCGYIENGSLQ